MQGFANLLNLGIYKHIHKILACEQGTIIHTTCIHVQYQPITRKMIPSPWYFNQYTSLKIWMGLAFTQKRAPLDSNLCLKRLEQAVTDLNNPI